ncbi:MAG: LamG-like jellyroll fold domain-containing protein [Luteolibacter sp.]
MQPHRSNRYCLPCLSRHLYACAAAMALATAPLHAEVKVEFKNTGLLNTANTSIGTVTLAFTVDGIGNVMLNASTSSTAPASVNAVNAWDGPVGTISHPGAFNSTFTLTMGGFATVTATSSDLRLTDIFGGVSTGGIVGVPGSNQYRIDNNANETIRFTATSVPAGSKLKLTSMNWLNSNGSPTQRAWSPSPSVNATNAVTTAGGTWDLSSSGFTLGASELVNFGTTSTGDTGKGYSFRAISFDIIDASSILPPAGLVATTDGAKVDLNWSDTSSAASYSVYRSETQGGPYGAAIASGLTTSDYTDNTVSTGSTYYYVVTATDATPTESGNSNEASILVAIQPPAALTRTQGDGVINLDWADNTSGILDFYSVYRSETQGGPYTQVATSLTTSEYADDTVTNGTTYYYVVTATDNVAAGESANSSEVSGTPFVPVSGSALFAHLDGSDSESVTVDGSGIVSLWADQTANGLDASSTGGVGTVLYPASSQGETGLDGLDMGFTPGKSTLRWFTAAQQDQWLNFNSGAGALPYGGFAVFTVVRPDTVLGGTSRDVVMSSTESNFALRYEGGRPQVRLGNAVLQGTLNAVSPGKTVVLAVNYNATTGQLHLWDSASGATSTATVPAADFSSGADLFLGGSVNSDQYMKGMLGEAKVYRGVLSPAEFGNEMAGLAFKWTGLQTPSGLTASSGDGTVVLDWNDQVADFYTIYRGEAAGGPYTELATNVLTSTYTDTTCQEGTRYYYAVSATESSYGESVYSNEVAIIPFTPVPGNSLYVHLDATNAASVTTTSGVVNAWQDLTANGINAVEVANGTPAEDIDTGDVRYPSTSLSGSGLAGLDFGVDRNVLKLFDPAGQDAWLDFSSAGLAQPYSGFAVFIALKADSILGVTPDFARDVVFANADNVAGKFLIRYQSGRPEMYLNGVAAVQGANRIVAGDTVILAANYNAATGALEFWDSASGSSANATVPAADFSSLKGMLLGGSVNAAQRMHGMIGEVKIYRGTMTATEFANERDSLVTKWVAAAQGGYSAWQTANNTAGAVDQDHDGDGVSNGVEYLLGGESDTTGFTPLPGVADTAGVLSVTWNKGTGFSGDYGTDFWIESSTTLIGEWTTETLPGGNVTDDPGFVKYTFPAPLTGKRFVRLKVAGP